MKIQFKLILVGFVVIAVLMAVVGFVTMRGFQNISVQMEEVVKENWPAAQYISEMRQSVREHSTAHSEYIEAALSKRLGVSNKDVEAHYKLGNEIAMAAMEKFNKSFEDFKETKIFREVAAAAAADMNTLMDLEEKLEVAYRTENHDLAEETMNEFDNFVESTDENLAKIQSSINQRMDEALARANAAAAAGRILAIGVIVAVLLALGMGVFVSRSVAKPLKELQDTAEAIAVGDLSKRAAVRSKDEIGRVAAAFNSMTDSLIETRKLPENIIRSMADSLMVVTAEAKIKEVNQATLDLLGYERKELVGEPIEKVFGRAAAAAAAAAAETIFKGAGLEKLIKEGAIKDKEMTYRTKKGEEILVSISGSVMKDENGKMIGIVVSAKDMREVQKLQREKLALLESSKKELEVKVKERTSELQASEQQLKAANQQLGSAMEELEIARAGLEKRVEERTAELAEKISELEEWRDVTTGRELKMMELKEEMKRLRKKCGEPVGKIEKELELPPLPKAPPAAPKAKPAISPDKRQDEEISTLKKEIEKLKGELGKTKVNTKYASEKNKKRY